MTEPVVLEERHGAVALITLNRPDRLNAWTLALEERYFALLAAADADPDVGAIVVTGAGRGFCAGYDLDELARFAREEQIVFGARPRSFPLTVRKPLIGAINGACAGLGLVEALYCDVRFGALDAKLTTSFAQRGLIAEYGIAWLLPRVVGHARAMDLLLSGRVVLGEEAERIGLLEFAVAREQVVPRALAYAADLAESCSPTAMATIKAQVRRGLSSELDTALDDADALMRASFHHADVAEGVASYVQRRAPRFARLPRA